MVYKIDVGNLGYHVYLNNNCLGFWVNIEGALEAIRLEVDMRSKNGRNNPYRTEVKDNQDYRQ